jgi:hypothetical protein
MYALHGQRWQKILPSGDEHNPISVYPTNKLKSLRGKPGITENNIVFAHACWHGLQRHGRKNRKKLKH